LENLKAQSTRAIAWEFIGKLAINSLGFLVYIILARLLQPSDFGLIAMIMVIIGIAGIFTDIGLGAALIQRRRTLAIHYSSVFYFNLLIGFLFTIATYASAPLISDFYEAQELLPLIQAMSLLFVVNAFSSVQTILLRKELDYATLTRIGLISTVISGGIGITMAFSGAGVWSLVAQSLSNGIAYNAIIWAVSRWSPGFQFSPKALRYLWGFGFRMFLVELLNAVYIRMDSLIIGKLFAPATLGFYQMAKSINQLAIQYSSGSLMSVLFPVLSKVQNDLPRFQNIVIKGFGVISFIVFLLFGTLFLVADELIVILLSEKWMQSAEYFKILAISGLAFPINALLVNVLSSRGNSKAFLRMAIYKKCVGFINLGVGFIFGIKGFLYGLIIVSIINTCITITVSSREAKLDAIGFYRPVFLQFSIAAISLFATIYITSQISISSVLMLLVECTIYPSFYVFISWIFKTASFKYTLEQMLPVVNAARNCNR
jgi:O-antigen/teichoic acid export membrane protein